MAVLIACFVALGALTGTLIASLYDAYRRDERDNRSIHSSELDQ